MRILITGNQGYVGSVLVPYLTKNMPKARLIGADVGWFAHCLTTRDNSPEIWLRAQTVTDIRHVTPADVSGFDTCIHLAGVSNDAGGERFDKATDTINAVGTETLAKRCAAMGVRKFIFASSCSVYGDAAEHFGCMSTEETQVRPLTRYAQTKVDAEKRLRELSRQTDMRIVSLRFATACGPSPRLRSDLVLNTMVADALKFKTVRIHGTGLQWRPLIDVRDMARAIHWALELPNAPGYLTINVGCDANNLSIVTLGSHICRQLGAVMTQEGVTTDQRSYAVVFDLFKKLAPKHQPIWSLEATIADTAELIQECGPGVPRLPILIAHKKQHLLNEELELNRP